VGKSSLVLRFVTNNFKPYSESTIGASFMSKTILVDTKQIKFQIWDTAGQEKYHSLAPMYYRGAAAAIVVYDITRASTFKTLKKWVEELKNQGPADIAIVVTGNKADLESQREIDSAVASAYADEIGATYLETSAKDDMNVHDVFVQLGRKLPQPQEADSNIIRGASGLRQPAPVSSGGCC
jgi:small GTP-binding protein